MAVVPPGVDTESPPPPLSKATPELADIPKAETKLADAPIDSSPDTLQTPLTESVESLLHENSNFGSSFPDPDEQYMQMAIELAKLEYVTIMVCISRLCHLAPNGSFMSFVSLSLVLIAAGNGVLDRRIRVPRSEPC
jgi:hypothetical protein